MPNNGKSMANEKGKKSSGNCIKILNFKIMKNLSKIYRDRSIRKTLLKLIC